MLQDMASAVNSFLQKVYRQPELQHRPALWRPKLKLQSICLNALGGGGICYVCDV